MNFPKWLSIRDDIAVALQANQPVVALESTLISHGLPWPTNIETAKAAEQIVRSVGAIPATIGLIQGVPTIGLSERELEFFAQPNQIAKLSQRDLATAMHRQQHGATTVAATMFLAHHAGINIFATGGIGGVHRDTPETSWDISADLTELARTPVLVVCAGAKSILDLPRTLEMLETLSVPVIGYRTSTLPGFYLETTGLAIPTRFETPAEIARWWQIQSRWNSSGGLVCQPLPHTVAIQPAEFDGWLKASLQEAVNQQIRGAATTPFLLQEIARRSQGKTLIANQALIIENARLAAEIAVAIKT